MAVHPAPSSNSHLTGNGPVSMHTTEDIDMMPSKGQHTYPSPAGFSLRFRWHRKKLNPAKWALSRVSFLLPCSTQSWPKENHSSKAGHYYYCRTNAIVSFLSFHGFIRDQRRPIFEGVTTFFSCTQWSQNWARREKKSIFKRCLFPEWRQRWFVVHASHANTKWVLLWTGKGGTEKNCCSQYTITLRFVKFRTTAEKGKILWKS